jgi:hypothetical protein
VSSSIANLYGLPRVQLEGYHSLGWGAAPAQLMAATCENYLYGCNLLSLHGLYYTTYGSHWEWAPPCYHFRMPYWAHMGTFLRYFERLSYLMSQGHHVCDVAVIYPVTPYQAEMNGDRARDTAFDIAGKLMAAGINFDFVDHQSLARAETAGGKLTIPAAAASYRALIVPDMDAVRWSTLEQAAAFAKSDGLVLVVGALPSASDRAGQDDAELAAMNDAAFKTDCRLATADEAVAMVRNAFVQDVRGLRGPVLAQHRRIGRRDVYMVMGAVAGDIVEFRARGRVELWDPWNGEARALAVAETATGTQVVLPLAPHEAQLVVFTPGDAQAPTPVPAETEAGLSAPADGQLRTLSSDGWRVSFEPTMDNRDGDFRLPVTPDNTMIGVEARRFRWTRETATLAETAMLPTTDDTAWPTQLHGHGPQFYVLGPVPATMNATELEPHLAARAHLDPTTPAVIGGESWRWRPYAFSWRFGKEEDPGHQGFHGLKGTISDNFIRLGRFETRNCGVGSLVAEGNSRYYLWTTAYVSEDTDATVLVSRPRAAATNASPVNAPAAIFINGVQLEDVSAPVPLRAGANPMLLRYDDHGESHVVLRRLDAPAPTATVPLAMRWAGDPGVIPFDPCPDDSAAEWFRFLSAPGTTAIEIGARSVEPVQAWIDGTPMHDEGDGRYVAAGPSATAAVVALRLAPATGFRGGAAIPEPIRVETSGDGVMALGDWSEVGILNNYSGGVRYRTTVSATEEEAAAPATLDLGHVLATAEVTVNGASAGVRIAPPWRFPVTGLLRPGTNELEVVVYSTLANHYQTIPSPFRGHPAAGLFGPVQLATC